MDRSDWLAWQVLDSAFPTGAFAHSWGLESAWQHGEVPDVSALAQFVADSLAQAGHGSLPLVNAAYRSPDQLEDLDEQADAFLLNAVANRASRQQGRTLLATATRVWPSPALTAIEARTRAGCAHLAPLTGVVFRAIRLPLETVQRIVLFAAMRGVLSAAVRLGIVGSYEAQRLQSASIRHLDAVLLDCAALGAHAVTQTAPIIDLLQARHDHLYSRLFQS
jgi:urease accessory protein